MSLPEMGGDAGKSEEPELGSLSPAVIPSAPGAPAHTFTGKGATGSLEQREEEVMERKGICRKDLKKWEREKGFWPLVWGIRKLKG